MVPFEATVLDVIVPFSMSLPCLLYKDPGHNTGIGLILPMALPVWESSCHLADGIFCGSFLFGDRNLPMGQ